MIAYVCSLGDCVQNTFDFIVIVCSVLFGFGLFCAVLYRLELRRKSIKYSLVAIVFLCGYGVITHTYKQSTIQAKITEFQTAFHNDETLVCVHNNTEVHVHKTTFVYFKDLLVFSGKDSMKGVSVPLMTCTQHVTTHDVDFIND